MEVWPNAVNNCDAIPLKIKINFFFLSTVCGKKTKTKISDQDHSSSCVVICDSGEKRRIDMREREEIYQSISSLFE